MKVFAEDPRFGTFITDEFVSKQKGAISMCELLDLYIDRGKAEGAAETKISILTRYLKRHSAADAIEDLGVTQEEILKAQELLKKES